jgi:beta-1,4-N-acetylglucosaminyltransferase
VKICLVSSCGGHLAELRQLRPAYEVYPHFYVINDRIILPPDMAQRTYFISHAERDLGQILNLWEALRILRRERPDVIMSTGAGPAVPFALWGKLFGIRILFIETIARIQAPSLTGRLMYRLADRFFYQWRGLAEHFPRGRYVGPLW